MPTPLLIRVLLFAATCYLISLPARGQSKPELSYADSLKFALKQLGQDTERVKTLNRLSWTLRSSEPGEAMGYAEQARDLAERIGYDKGRGDSYNYIGVIRYRRGEYVDAAKAHLQALAIRERIGDSYGMALSYVNLGNVYSDQNNNTLALDYYKNASELLDKNSGQKLSPTVNLNISAIYLSQEKYEEGFAYCVKARNDARRLGDKSVEAQALNNIGVVYQHQLRFEEALDVYTEAYAISESIGDKTSMVDQMINIGNMYRVRKQYAKAIDWHNRTETMARDLGYLEGLRVLYEELSKDYAEMGNYEVALKYHVRFKEVNDSLFNDENTTRMTELTNRWQDERREKELIKKEQEIAQRKEAERRANQRLWFIGSGAFLLFVFAGYVLYAYNRIRRTGVLLATQNEVIERKNEELGVKNKDITDSIIYSRRIQQAMLPSAERMRQLLPEAFVLYRPRDIVSGDFYWVESWGNEVLVAAGDCTGHGVPGALLSVVGLNLLNQSLQVYGIAKPAPILNALNRGVAQTLGQKFSNADVFTVNDGMDIALVTIDRAKMKAEFAAANNPLWLYRRGEITEIRGDRQPVGQYIHEHLRPFTNHEVALQPGDALYLFTDGYADQFGGPNGKKYKYARLNALLRSIGHLPMAEQRQTLEREIDQWKGMHPQVDDMLVIGIRI